MADIKTIDMFLVGDFNGANIHVGDGFITKSIEQSDLDNQFHDVEYKGRNYRFVNAANLSEQSIEIFKKRDDAVIFAGDLHGMFIEVTSGGIRSQYVEELDTRSEMHDALNV